MIVRPEAVSEELSPKCGRFLALTDPAGDGSVECTSCGAVWILASKQADQTGAAGAAGAGECLHCGGTLLPLDVTGPET